MCVGWAMVEWLVEEFNFLFPAWISLGSITLITLILYSLLIDILFGHQSYWAICSPSSSSSSSAFFSPPSSVIPKLFKNSSYSFHSSPTSTSAPYSSFLLVDHEDLILYLLQFLTASDLLSLSQTSHRFSLLSSQNYLWLTLAKNSFTEIPQLQPILTSQFRQLLPCSSSSSSPRSHSPSSLSSSRSLLPQRLYFHYLNRYPQLFLSFLLNKPLAIPPFDLPPSSFHPPLSLLSPPLPSEEQELSDGEDRRALVILHHCVYDLTPFLPRHPGGDAIIREYHGQDATRIFDLAMHSQIATKIAAEYCLWRRTDFCHSTVPGTP
jgi:hypothetical protein